MNYDRAMETLFSRGWDFYGASAIVDQLEEDHMLDGMTTAELIAISDDYADR